MPRSAREPKDPPRCHQGVNISRKRSVAALLTLAVAGACTTTRTPGFSAPSVRPGTAEALDGFQITVLPERAVRVGDDSTYTDTVGGVPDVSVTMRRFERGTGVPLFVSVLRPRTDPARTTDRLARWPSQGAAVGGFDAPAGAATLIAEVGSETTNYHAVVVNPQHVVITVEGV